MVEPTQGEVIEQLADLERRAALRASSELERELSRQRFLARADERLRDEARPAGWLRLSWLGPVVVVAAAAVLFVLLRAPALTFEVEGAELSGQYVSAPEDHAAELRFSDASTVVAAAGSRLRVEGTSARGARVLLERGKTSVHVVHRDSTAWSFAAGPYDVRVTGTRFDLSWDAARESCSLVLHEGSVEVRGPTGSGPVAVRSGQRFEADAKRRTMQVLELGAASATITPTAASPPPATPSPPPPAEAKPSESATATAPNAAPERAGSGEARPETWSERIAQGKFKEVVSDAEARGIAGCLASCSAADLRALSDAARYTGSAALAEQALTSLRQRFPGAQAAEAAFLLGRLQEKRGAMGVAQTWYDTYLREAPRGSFAAEALAGKLRAVKATQGRSAARPVAREYLKRFPKGVHVETAREILGDE